MPARSESRPDRQGEVRAQCDQDIHKGVERAKVLSETFRLVPLQGCPGAANGVPVRTILLSRTNFCDLRNAKSLWPTSD